MIRISAVEPCELLQDSILRVVCGVDVLGAKFGLHGIDEDGGVVVTPFCELRDVEGC